MKKNTFWQNVLNRVPVVFFRILDSKSLGVIFGDFIFQNMGFSHGISMPSPALRAQGEELIITFAIWYSFDWW